jgi:hypothetical protein
MSTEPFSVLSLKPGLRGGKAKQKKLVDLTKQFTTWDKDHKVMTKKRRDMISKSLTLEYQEANSCLSPSLEPLSLQSRVDQAIGMYDRERTPSVIKDHINYTISPRTAQRNISH